ncbi:myelin-oligodendrocyte glycoprotein-like isoform X2 [Simochromis diagramma]|uniref:myelin-oligodendrocyte glycoprotein-like isoform X2 n=1 Tax=Simochromis diagramma TaxID=43689 RepID=UPI001A7E311C|nr:myelin-oligodendrocyte glycoprotein-like isoform X2 [Simochromis diagramma]
MSSALQHDVQAKLGVDVTLQCEISTDEIISVLKWSRADLNTDGYVYFYRNKRSYENYQHPSFHGRVKLKDPEMKDGDVSLILKNVTFNDTGMYECHIAVRNPERSKRVHTEISHFINLTVTAETHDILSEKQIMEKGDGHGNMDDAERVGSPTLQVVVPVVVVVVVALVAVGFGVHRQTRQHKKQHLVKLPSEDSAVV